MIYFKYFITITIFISCFLIALNTYRLYVLINKQTFHLVFRKFNINLKKANISLTCNLFFDHRISFKEIINSDHKYFFYLITPPAMAIYIRSVYSEFHQFDYGIFMLTTFLLLIIGLYLYFFYKHFQFLKNIIHRSQNEIILKSTKYILDEGQIEFFKLQIEKDFSNFNPSDRTFFLEY